MVKELDLKYISVYLVEENGAFMLIDTGGYIFADGKTLDNRRELLDQKLQEAGVTKDNLKLIVLTHGDCDHSMNALYFSEKYDAPIAMNEADVKMVQSPDLDLLMRTINYRKAGMKLLAKLMYGIFSKQMAQVLNDFETFTPGILLKDGDRLEEYGFHATAIHIPGHTPGSMGVVTDEGEAIVGDAGPKTPNAVDFDSFDKSVERIMSAGYKAIYMGHYKPIIHN